MSFFTTPNDDAIFAPRNVLAWTLLSASAGSVNAAAFLAGRSFVSHVTGALTNVGMEAARRSLVTEACVVLGCFLGGAMLAVLFVETVGARRRAAYVSSFLLVPLLLGGIAIAGRAGLLGAFGAPEQPHALFLLGLLALAMGAQNASVAVATKNAVRTTHATGPMTDLAGNLVRAALGVDRGTGRELRWALLRIAKIVGFVAGALIASAYAETLGFAVFAVSALFSVVATAFAFAPRPREESSVETAPLGD